MTLVFTPLKGIPLINKGDDIPKIIISSLHNDKIILKDNDIIVITQKIISKSEGRLVNLNEIIVSEKAKRLSQISDKDPRLIELIVRESNEIIRATKKHLIVEHRLGFICANAGIDHSNVFSEEGDPEDFYLLLPENPDKSANRIQKKIKRITGKKTGILIIDSHGRAWRNGILGTTIGLAGVPGLVDLRGKEDLFGYKLCISLVAAADELAASASLLMGQANEKIPVVHVRGFPYPLRKSSLKEIIRPKEYDLFR